MWNILQGIRGNISDMLEHSNQMNLIKSPSTLTIMGTPIKRVATPQLNHLILILLIIGPPMESVRHLHLQPNHQAVMNHLTMQWLQSLIPFINLWSKVILGSNAAIICSLYVNGASLGSDGIPGE